MEENRYYKPSFEEVFVGLEYEFYTEKGWKKWQISEKTDFSRFQHMLKLNKIRVKKLDVESFSDLGFKRLTSYNPCKILDSKSDVYINEDIELFVHHYKELGVVKTFSRDLSKIIMTEDVNGEIKITNIDQINRIKIKNKSEFKRLLNQLGIYDD